MIVPTKIGDADLSGAAAAASTIDFLSIATEGAVTEQKIAASGAMIGESVGNKVWTLGSLPPEGVDNINEMITQIGLGDGNISNHVAYGSILINSSQAEDTLMFVGSDDAVKVWLNGVSVHEHFVNRGAADYQDVFKVTLKQGTNVLLVAVYEAYGGWSGFFGFETLIEYEILPPRGLSVDVNEDDRVNASDLLLVTMAVTSKDYAKVNPLTDVDKNGVVNIADIQLVIVYLDDPVTGASPALQKSVSHPRGKLVSTWAKLKTR